MVAALAEAEVTCKLAGACDDGAVQAASRKQQAARRGRAAAVEQRVVAVRVLSPALAEAAVMPELVGACGGEEVASACCSMERRHVLTTCDVFLRQKRREKL